jgi:hypothetical protein
MAAAGDFIVRMRVPTGMKRFAFKSDAERFGALQNMVRLRLVTVHFESHFCRRTFPDRPCNHRASRLTQPTDRRIRAQVQSEFGIAPDAQLISIKPLADPEVLYRLFFLFSRFSSPATVAIPISHPAIVLFLDFSFVDAVLDWRRRPNIPATGHQV